MVYLYRVYVELTMDEELGSRTYLVCLHGLSSRSLKSMFWLAGRAPFALGSSYELPGSNALSFVVHAAFYSQPFVDSSIVPDFHLRSAFSSLPSFQFQPAESSRYNKHAGRRRVQPSCRSFSTMLQCMDNHLTCCDGNYPFLRDHVCLHLSLLRSPLRRCIAGDSDHSLPCPWLPIHLQLLLSARQVYVCWISCTCYVCVPHLFFWNLYQPH